jgi:hypothetical protein
MAPATSMIFIYWYNIWLRHFKNTLLNMKPLFWLAILSFYISTVLFAQALPPVNQLAFKPGEKLTYKVYYNLFSLQAGTATFEVREALKKVGTRDCYNIVGTGKTTEACDLFFPVRDHYESYIDTTALLPWRFVRIVNEGGFKFDDFVRFDQYSKTATSKKNKETKYPLTLQTHDVISALYYFRTIDWSKAEINQAFMVDIFLDEKIHQNRITYLGKETIKTDLGKFSCFKVRPVLITGNVFKENAEMTIWVTDDANRIPIRIESEIVVGKVKADLIDYVNIRNEFSAKVR